MCIRDRSMVHGTDGQKRVTSIRRTIAMAVPLPAPTLMVSMRRWWALAGITLGVLAVGLDVTVLSVALPTLATSLKASESDLQWFTSAYAVALAAAMLPAGVLGYRFGRKKMMLGALVVFGAASIACSYSPTPGVFIASRNPTRSCCSRHRGHGSIDHQGALHREGATACNCLLYTSPSPRDRTRSR